MQIANNQGVRIHVLQLLQLQLKKPQERGLSKTDSTIIKTGDLEAGVISIIQVIYPVQRAVFPQMGYLDGELLLQLIREHGIVSRSS